MTLSKKIQELEKDSKNGEGGEERGRGKGTRRGKGGNAALNECIYAMLKFLTIDNFIT